MRRGDAAQGRKAGIGRARMPVRLLLAALLVQLAGCALVHVKQDNPRTYDENRRGDVLTTGALSFATRNAISRLGLDPDDCVAAATPCIGALRQATLLDNDARLSALAELALSEALQADKTAAATDAHRVSAYLDAARYAYAYLFFGDRSPRERAFEDRQTQVRDDYNYAVERVAALMFERGRRAGRLHPPVPGSTQAVDGWQLRYGSIELVL